MEFIQTNLENNDEPEITNLNFKIANVTIIDNLDLTTKIYHIPHLTKVNHNMSICSLNVTIRDKKKLVDFTNLMYLNTSDLNLALSSFETIVNKNDICLSCLNKLTDLKEIQLEIKKLKLNIFRVFSKTLTKQNLVQKTSEKINELNYIKVKLSSIQSELNLLKKLNCKNYEENNQVLTNLLKWTSSLVETIQNAIRKTNLNINFLIIL
jgi:hypothetical protein